MDWSLGRNGVVETEEGKRRLTVNGHYKTRGFDRADRSIDRGLPAAQRYRDLKLQQGSLRSSQGAPLRLPSFWAAPILTG